MSPPREVQGVPGAQRLRQEPGVQEAKRAPPLERCVQSSQNHSNTAAFRLAEGTNPLAPES